MSEKKDLKPEPQKDYKEPYQYKRNKLPILQILIVTFFVPLIIFLPTFYELFFIFLENNLIIFTLIFILSILFKTYTHELVHALAMKLSGNRPEIKFQRKNILPQPKAVSTDKFMNAKKHIKTFLAPLFIIDIIAVIIILIDVNNILTYFSLLVLWLNTTGSSNDIYDAYRFYKLPDKTLVYTPKENTDISYLSEPN